MKALGAHRRIVPRVAQISALADSTTFKNLALVAFISGIAFFVLAPGMGLYEDDFSYIAQPAGWSIGRLGSHILWAVSTMLHGRPLGWVLPQIISFFGWRIGGLPVIYFFAYLVTLLNAGLFYFLLKRFAGETFALFGTFGLVLFPADTTRPLLVHAFSLQLSITFCLVASLLYFTKRRPWSYLVAAACLLTYESPFLPFLWIPLLELPWNRARLGALARHLVVCALLVVVDLVLRRLVGEARTVTALTDPLLTVYESVAGMAMGPVVSVSTFGYRFLAPLQSTNQLVWVGTFLAAVVLVWRLSGVGDRFWTFARGKASAETNLRATQRLPEALPPYPYLILAGLMLVSAYAFGFTHFPPTLTNGRMTSVHLAAAIGGGILFGWIATAFLNVARRAHLEWLAGTVLGLYLAGLVGFGLVIQTDFVSAWRQEQSLWSQIIDEAGDADPETVILVEGLPKRTAAFIDPFAPWTVLGMLGMFYGPDRENKPIPMPLVYFAAENWNDYLTPDGDSVQMDHPELSELGEIRTTLQPNKFILLRYQDGELVRMDAGFELNGKVYAPKPRTENLLAELPRRPLYDVLIDPMLK